MTTTSTTDLSAISFDALVAMSANYGIPDHIDLLAEIAFKYDIPTRLRLVVTMDDDGFTTRFLKLLKTRPMSCVFDAIDVPMLSKGYVGIDPSEEWPSKAFFLYTKELFEKDRTDLVAALLKKMEECGGDAPEQLENNDPVIERCNPAEGDGVFANMVFPNGRVAHVCEIVDNSAWSIYGPATGSARPKAMEMAERDLRFSIGGYKSVRGKINDPVQRASLLARYICFDYVKKDDDDLFPTLGPVSPEEADEFIRFLTSYADDYHGRILNVRNMVAERESAMDRAFENASEYIRDACCPEYE